MIIGFDASRAFVNKKTGTENYSFQLLQKLLKVDQTNEYYVYTRLSLDTRDLKLDDEARGWKLENTDTPASTFQPQDQASNFQSPASTRFINIPLPRLWTQLGLALRTFIDPLDVLFIPSHTLPLVRKPGLKTVVTVHDLGSEYLPQTHQFKQRLYLDLMTHYQLKSATHLIAVSQSTKDDLIKKVGIDPEKITVVYEGYNKQVYRGQPACRQGRVTSDSLKRVLDRYNLKPETYFLFVGTIQPRKNLSRLIEAYAVYLKKLRLDTRNLNLDNEARGLKLDNAANPASTFQPQDPISSFQNQASIPFLVLAGSKGWLSDEIYQLPVKLGIEDKVKFLGYVPDQDLPALYSGAKAFLFPSLFEGFGLPILEAMACGCPVLTSNTSSLPEVAGPPAGGAAILVDPYSIDSISQGIKEMERQEKREKLIKMGFEQVKKFSWEKAAQETLKVLQNL